MIDIKNSDLPVLISFSGGRTSAFMTKFLLEHPWFANKQKVVCYANTSKEKEATLEFVNECDMRWGLGVVWLEADVTYEKGIGTTFRLIDFKSANRDGRVFEDVIKKYGVPNKQFMHCTRELKQMPMGKYMRSLGYNNWITAVGFRADEPHRLNYNNKDTNFINPFYPLNDMVRVDAEFIRTWWDRQPFDLKLKDYQNNCDLCWKKSLRKKLTLISEDPTVADWWDRMEKEYGGDYQFDQRDGFKISDLIKMAQQPFQKALDAHELRDKQHSLFEVEMDLETGCFCKAS